MDPRPDSHQHPRLASKTRKHQRFRINHLRGTCRRDIQKSDELRAGAAVRGTCDTTLPWYSTKRYTESEYLLLLCISSTKPPKTRATPSAEPDKVLLDNQSSHSRRPRWTWSELSSLSRMTASAPHSRGCRCRIGRSWGLPQAWVRCEHRRCQRERLCQADGTCGAG